MPATTHNPMKHQQSVFQQHWQSIAKTVGLLQVLCKTYKKDTIFASSLIKLLAKLDEDLVKMQAKMSKIDEKKASYKKMAKMQRTNYSSTIQQERAKFDEIKNDHRKLIGQQELQIEELQQQNQELRDKIETLVEQQHILSSDVESMPNHNLSAELVQAQRALEEAQMAQALSEQQAKQAMAQAQAMQTNQVMNHQVKPRLINKTLQRLLSHERTQETFNKHFKSVQEFNPYNTTKMLKLMQDLVKLYVKLVQEPMASNASLLPKSACSHKPNSFAHKTLEQSLSVGSQQDQATLDNQMKMLKASLMQEIGQQIEQQVRNQVNKSDLSGQIHTQDNNTTVEYQQPDIAREYFSTKPSAAPQSKVSTHRGHRPNPSDEYFHQYPGSARFAGPLQNQQKAGHLIVPGMEGQTNPSQGTTPRTISNYLNPNHCVLSYSTDTIKNNHESGSINHYDFLIENPKHGHQTQNLGTTDGNLSAFDNPDIIAEHDIEDKNLNSGPNSNKNSTRNHLGNTQSTFGGLHRKQVHSSPTLNNLGQNETPSPGGQSKPELVPEETRNTPTMCINDLVQPVQSTHESSIFYKNRSTESYDIPLQNTGISAVVHKTDLFRPKIYNQQLQQLQQQMEEQQKVIEKLAKENADRKSASAQAQVPSKSPSKISSAQIQAGKTKSAQQYQSHRRQGSTTFRTGAIVPYRVQERNKLQPLARSSSNKSRDKSRSTSSHNRFGFKLVDDKGNLRKAAKNQ